MKIQILKMSRKYKADSLPSLFCRSDSIYCESLLKGILIIDDDIGYFKKGDQLVVINNPDNLSKNEILSRFNIGQIEDIEMKSVLANIIKYGNYVSFNEYKRKYLDNLKERKREIMVKHKTRKEYEANKHIFTAKEIEKLYNSLHLPDDPNINKADFLEYYLYFNKNINTYKVLKYLKKDMSWKDFRNNGIGKMRNRDIRDIRNIKNVYTHKHIELI